MAGVRVHRLDVLPVVELVGDYIFPDAHEFKLGVYRHRVGRAYAVKVDDHSLLKQPCHLHELLLIDQHPGLLDGFDRNIGDLLDNGVGRIVLLNGGGVQQVQLHVLEILGFLRQQHLQPGKSLDVDLLTQAHHRGRGGEGFLGQLVHRVLQHLFGIFQNILPHLVLRRGKVAVISQLDQYAHFSSSCFPFFLSMSQNFQEVK